jgi:hypothetical protein
MGTKATIAIKREGGIFESIFVSCDGYPEHTGRVLNEFYKEKEKVEALIERGCVYFLDEKIGDTFDGGLDFPKFKKNHGDKYRKEVRDAGFTEFAKRDYSIDNYWTDIPENLISDFYPNVADQQWNYLYEYGEWWVTGILYLRDFTVHFNREKIEKCIENIKKIHAAFPCNDVF